MPIARRSPMVRYANRADGAGALVSIAAAMCLALPAHGQESAPAPAGTTPPAALDTRPVTIRLDITGEHAFKTDLDGAGDASVSRAGGWLGVRVPVEQYHVLDLEFSSEFSFYHFGAATTLAPATGDPLGGAQDTRIGARFFLRTAERWGLYAGGDVGAGSETGARFGDSITGGATAGFVYWISERFNLGAGINIRSTLENGITVLPSVNIDWKLSDTLTLATSQRIIDRGGGVTLAYAPAPAWTFSLGAAYETREYRLDEDGEAPKGALRDLRLPVTLGVTWKLTDTVTLSAKAGAYVSQRYTLRAANGDEIAHDDTGVQPFFGLGAEFSF